MILTDESFPHLNNAPIVEAVIDLRAQFDTNWDENSLLSSLKEALPEYPNVEQTDKIEGRIVFGKEHKAETRNFGLNGYVFKSNDEEHVAQFQKEGFIFSRMAPYQSWDEFFAEAKRLWHIYCDINTPEIVTRLGLRYVNRIDVGSGSTEKKIEDYLKNVPKPPAGFKWPFISFFHRDVWQIPDTNYSIIFNRVLEQPDNKTSFIIDIDVFRLINNEAENIWDQYLPEMRGYKNTLFFNSVSDKQLEKMK